jgi:hypothetical protein
VVAVGGDEPAEQRPGLPELVAVGAVAEKVPPASAKPSKIRRASSGSAP